jgi:hypothetical protein
VLIDELVRVAWPHRGKLGFREALAVAVEVLLAWRRRRILHSRAAYLRARQDLADWAAGERADRDEAT